MISHIQRQKANKQTNKSGFTKSSFDWSHSYWEKIIAPGIKRYDKCDKNYIVKQCRNIVKISQNKVN